MSTSRSLTAALCVAALALAGCGKNPAPTAPTASGAGTDPTAADRAQIEQALANSPTAVDDQTFGDGEQTTVNSGAGGFALIHPVRYWRHIDSIQRSLDFEFGDPDSTGQPTTAVVTLHRRLNGTFDILAGGWSDGATDSLQLVTKPLEDHWVRRILLKRVRQVTDSLARWRIAAISGVKVTSRNAATEIRSLRIQAGALDTTVTDPLAFFRLRHVLRFDPLTPVTLTVTTGRNDDVVVLMHRGLRTVFDNNGDGTYTRTWMVADGDGLRHVGVNALSHGTLFDDQAPYDSQAWMLPYAASSEEMAEYMP